MKKSRLSGILLHARVQHGYCLNMVDISLQ